MSRKDEVLQGVRECLATGLDIPADSVREDMRIIGDLGADSSTDLGWIAVRITASEYVGDFVREVALVKAPATPNNICIIYNYKIRNKSFFSLDR